MLWRFINSAGLIEPSLNSKNGLTIVGQSRFRAKKQKFELRTNGLFQLLGARTLLGAPGLTTRSKKRLVTKGIATRSNKLQEQCVGCASVASIPSKSPSLVAEAVYKPDNSACLTQTASLVISETKNRIQMREGAPKLIYLTNNIANPATLQEWRL